MTSSPPRPLRSADDKPGIVRWALALLLVWVQAWLPLVHAHTDLPASERVHFSVEQHASAVHPDSHADQEVDADHPLATHFLTLLPSCRILRDAAVSAKPMRPPDLGLPFAGTFGPAPGVVLAEVRAQRCCVPGNAPDPKLSRSLAVSLPPAQGPPALI